MNPFVFVTRIDQPRLSHTLSASIGMKSIYSDVTRAHLKPRNDDQRLFILNGIGEMKSKRLQSKIPPRKISTHILDKDAFVTIEQKGF